MKILTIMVLLVILSLFSFFSFATNSAQNKIPKDSCALRFYGLKSGLGFSKFGIFDIGISNMRVIDNTCDQYGTFGYNAGLELISNFKSTYIGPSLGFDLGFLLMHVRLSSTIFFDEKRNNSWIIRPEIGPTFLGYASILYGYNFHFLDNLNIKLAHQVSIRINLPKRHFKLIKRHTIRVS
jgi:hypothetical protein